MTFFLKKRELKEQHISPDYREWETLRQASETSGKVFRKMTKDA